MRTNPWNHLYEHKVWMLRTLFEGQQQQRGQSCDNGREQQDAAPAEVVGWQVNKDAGHAGGGHSDIVGQVKVGGVNVEVRGETVLDRNSYQAVGEVRQLIDSITTADRTGSLLLLSLSGEMWLNWTLNTHIVKLKVRQFLLITGLCSSTRREKNLGWQSSLYTEFISRNTRLGYYIMYYLSSSLWSLVSVLSWL